MYSKIRTYCDQLAEEYQQIPSSRKQLLGKLALYIKDKRSQNQPVNLVYICTHNSRRSHFGQVWAKVASEYYGIPGVSTFSGGTEATSFNKNAINALIAAGFTVKRTT